MCSGRIATTTTSLAVLHPQLAAEWHPTKNGSITPDIVKPGSGFKAWWCCSINSSHEWEAAIYSRAQMGTGCPRCHNKGWTLPAIREFVASLKAHLPAFTPAELYLIFRQSGLLQTEGKGRTFLKALVTGRFPLEELEEFVKCEPSLVDRFIEDPTQRLEIIKHDSEDVRSGEPFRTADGVADEEAGIEQLLDVDATTLITGVSAEEETKLPVLETKAVLAALNHPILASTDEEAIEFLTASAVAKLWKHAFQNEAAAVAQASVFTGDAYAERVAAQFLDEYRLAKDLPLPAGYDFRIDGQPMPPLLMQRLVAVLVRQRRRVGNWSGTGAGKTLSAILASRVINARFTLICCPNSVVEGWRQAILESFPDSIVAIKTFVPDWATVTGDPTARGTILHPTAHRYLILNYEMFQQPTSAANIQALLEHEQIDFVIIDEVHYTKQRIVENLSQRRQLLLAFLSQAGQGNPNLHVLALSATPVINTLQEGKSLIELVTGVSHDELETRPTVPNCMALHQQLVTLGVRWMPQYDLEYEQLEEPVDCSPFLDEIRALEQYGTPLQLEQILTRARLDAICQSIKPPTLIYTHYVEGIDRLLRDGLVAEGYSVGFYTGEDKSGLEAFLKGKLDVLIGSSAIGTGVDHLQEVCHHLIVNVLPWTHAEFEQLKGRLYRQGQCSEKVTLVLPLTYADVNGQRWSWCESKMQRLQFKKSIADAAVDGIVPEGHLRSPAQAYQDVIAWLERLERGETQEVSRQPINVLLPIEAAQVTTPMRRYGDFSAMNHQWNQSRSEVTHARLQAHPEEWAEYHALYREARKDWLITPYEEIIRWCQRRTGYVIGDFGCGEAKLAEQLSDQHTVYSFDHIAANAEVIACDMAHVPLEDEILDVAVFSLSLMGANVTDYLREAYRTLKLDGHLHIIEATSRFTDKECFVEGLRAVGFDVLSQQELWKFTHIRALKSERRPDEDIEMVL